LKDVELVAIADPSKSALSRVSRLGLKLYGDYGEMIRKEELDAVIIALPNDLHKDCSTLAAEEGRDILIEKPLARNTEEAKEITHAVRRNGVRLMVGMCQRFATGCQRLKEEVDAGTLGRIDFASGLFFTGPFLEATRVSEWMFNPLEVGGVLLDSGCHLIDLFLWYFGDIDLDSVAGRRESLLNLGYDDYAEVMMRFKNGVNALAVVSWRTRQPSYRIEVVGEYGRRVVVNKRFGMLDVGLVRAGLSFVKENALRKIRGGPFLPLGEEYYRELDYFVKCLINNDNPQPDVSDWLKVSEILDTVYAGELLEG
jgi:predicted dehydrogenase